MKFVLKFFITFFISFFFVTISPAFSNSFCSEGFFEPTISTQTKAIENYSEERIVLADTFSLIDNSKKDENIFSNKKENNSLNGNTDFYFDNKKQHNSLIKYIQNETYLSLNTPLRLSSLLFQIQPNAP